MYKSILECARVYWNVKEYTGICKHILGCARNVQECTGMCKGILRREIIQEYAGIYKSILGYTRVYWNLQEYTER